MTNSDVSPDALELMERRLSDRVEERVQKRLYALYAAIAAVLALLGTGGALTLAQIAVHSMVEPVAQEARESLDNTQAMLADVEAQVEDAENALARTRTTAEAAEEEVARTKQTVQRSKQDLDGLSTIVKGLQAEANDLDEVRDEHINALQVTYSELDGIYDSIRDVVPLIRSLRVRDGTVQTAAADPSGASRMRERELEKLFASLESRAESLGNTGRRTLFFKFDHMPTHVARGISTRLREKLHAEEHREPYVVLGAVREKMDRERREVLYFDAGDAGEARRLAEETMRTLAELKLGDLPVKVTSLDQFKGRKPRPRTIELWLSMPETAPLAPASLGRS